MFGGGLRPYRLAPIDRGCVNTVVFEIVDEDGNYENRLDKRFYLTAKTQPWDTDADDSDAIFKVEGTFSSLTEPGRVVFTLSETDTYQDPDVEYFYDIVQTNSDGTNANRLAIGNFNILPGPNNEQAGGDEE